MTNTHPDLGNISQITNSIFLSGIFPLEDNPEKIRKLKIKYILSCVDRNYISEIHDRILSDDHTVTILYLPYDDDVGQNLWDKANVFPLKQENDKDYSINKKLNLVKYVQTTNQYDQLIQLLNRYHQKPMIDVAYHFINKAIEQNENILIHCMAGVSRSVSMIVYYLIKKYHITFEQAITLIKEKRKIVNPNQSFVLQLQEYQKLRDNYTCHNSDDIINIQFLKTY